MVEKIYSILSNKFDLDEEVIERVTRSQFQFVTNTMEQGEFQSVRLHHLGVVGCKPARLKELQERNEYNKYSKS